MEGVFKVKILNGIKKGLNVCIVKPITYVAKGILSPILLLVDHNENKRLDDANIDVKKPTEKKLSPKEEKRRQARLEAQRKKREKEQQKTQKKIAALSKDPIKQKKLIENEAKRLKVARENLERQEKIRLEKQRKIEQIHAKQLKKEEELYQREKAKLEAKRRKEEIARQKREEKIRRRAQKKQKEKDVYYNESIPSNESKKKEGFFQKVNHLPSTISNKFKNNIFSKNARNKRDMNRQALLLDFDGEDAKRSDIKLIYEYEAKSPEGKIVKGHFEAFSRIEVHSFLLSEGYEVYKIHTNKWIALKYGRTASNKKKVKNKDLIFFLTQLSTYLKAGITLSESLKILARQFSKTKAYENIFKSINYELSTGESFSSALDKQGNAFPKLLVNMLKTAEMTGSLPEVLDDMAEYYTEMEESRRQMVTAMMYPSIVGIFAIGVITFIMVYVVPQFADIYSSMEGTEIPAFTRAVMWVSDFLKQNLLWILLAILLLVFGFYLLYKKNKSFRTVMQMMAMKMPIFGNTIIYSEVTTFTKTFGSLLSHNVPIVECMDILGKITNNEIYKSLILDVIANLSKGGKISDAFEEHWAFPIPAYEMIVTGEKTGELSEMMTKVSLYYQDLQKNAVARIKTFIEPALTVFLAAVTGLIVLAIVIPMFNMYAAVQNMS